MLSALGKDGGEWESVLASPNDLSRVAAGCAI